MVVPRAVKTFSGGWHIALARTGLIRRTGRGSRYYRSFVDRMALTNFSHKPLRMGAFLAYLQLS